MGGGGGGRGMFKGNVLSFSRSSDSLMLNVVGLLYSIVLLFLHYSRLGEGYGGGISQRRQSWLVGQNNWWHF